MDLKHFTGDSPLLREATVGTQAKNLKQKSQKNVHYWLAHLPRDGAAHSGLESSI